MALGKLVSGRRTRWLVVAVWVLAAAALAPLSGGLSAVEQNSQSSFVPTGAPSTKVAQIQAGFPALNNLPAEVVLYRPGGLTTPDRAFAAQLRVAVAALHLPGVVKVSAPVVSANGDGALVSVLIGPSTAATDVSSDVTRLDSLLGRAPAGLQHGVGGPAAVLADTASAFSGIDGILLLATVLLVTVLLLLTYRSAFLWLFPLLTVGLASVVGQAGVYLLARGGFVVNGMTVGILTVLMFGAGTDYALLLVSRYREELRAEPDASRAMATAITRVAPTLAVSAGTVILSLMALLAAQEQDIRALGPVGAIGIAAVLLGSLTLLPALLLVFGRGAFWPLVPRPEEPAPAARISWAATGAWVARHRVQLAFGTTAALLLLASGLAAYPGTLPQSRSFSHPVPSEAAQKLISRSFPAGTTGDVIVAVTRPSALVGARRIAARTPGITEVGRPVVRGSTSVFQAILAYSPEGSRAEAVVTALRSAESRRYGQSVLVGGQTATQLDLNQAASRDRAVVIPVVLLVVLIMLGLLLRAVVAPLVLVASVLLSFLAALGISSLAFRWLFGFPGVDTSVVLLGFVFLVALGVDYTVFLASRARQEVVRDRHRGFVEALGATGGVITSAGLVLAATFTVLGVLPLVALTELGFLVAVGVLLDTMVVRSLAVPAVALWLGERFWWPWTPPSAPQ